MPAWLILIVLGGITVIGIKSEFCSCSLSVGRGYDTFNRENVGGKALTIT